MMDQRWKKIFDKLNRGDPIKVGFMGGSITTGYAAQPPLEKGWAAGVAGWWKAQAEQTGSPVDILNRGVSGTDSALACIRVNEHLVDTRCDVVFVEFAMNDQWLDAAYRRESYETLLRKIIDSPQEPAVLALFVCEKGHPEKSQQGEQQPLCDYYGIPSVSMAHGVEKSNLDWDQLFSGSEEIHPNDAGHHALAGFIIQALEKIKTGVFPFPVQPRGFPRSLGSGIFDKVTLSGHEKLIPIKNFGWNPVGDQHPEWVNHGGSVEGWSTCKTDAVLEFAVTGRLVAVFFSESEHYRNMVAQLDDQSPVVLESYRADRQGYLGWHVSFLGQDLSPGPHTLRITVAPGAPAWEGRPVHLCGIFQESLP